MSKRRPNGFGTLFLRNGWFYYKTVKNGKAKCISCHTRSRETALRVMAQYATGAELPPEIRYETIKQLCKPPSANPTLDDAWEIYVNHPRNIGQSESARANDYSHWKALKWWLYGYHSQYSRLNARPTHPECKFLDDITLTIASEFIVHSKRTVSPTTVNRHIRILKRIWEFNRMENNPWIEFAKLPETHHKRRALTNQEVKSLIDRAEGELKILFTIGPYTGLRMSDCAQLQWNMIDMKEKIITLNPHKTRLSSGILVQIPIHPVLYKTLQSAYKQKTNNYVTPSLATCPRWRLSQIVMQHFTDCGLKEQATMDGYKKKTPTVGFHSFRSTFVQGMCDAGAPLSMVRAIVGHISEELTQLYYRSDIDRARGYLEKL